MHRHMPSIPLLRPNLNRSSSTPLTSPAPWIPPLHIPSSSKQTPHPGPGTPPASNANHPPRAAHLTLTSHLPHLTHLPHTSPAPRPGNPQIQFPHTRNPHPPGGIHPSIPYKSPRRIPTSSSSFQPRIPRFNMPHHLPDAQRDGQCKLVK